MLQTESGVRLLEHQDEITPEPCFKKMKSTEGAYEKLFDDDDYQGIQEEADAEKTSNDFMPVCISDNQGQHEMQKQEEIPAGVLGSVNEVLPKTSLVLSQLVDSETVQNVNPSFASINDTTVEEKTDPFITNSVHEDNIQASNTTISLSRNASDEEFFTSKVFIGPIYKPAESSKPDKSGSCNECSNSEADENELCESSAKRKESKKTQTVSSALEIDDELDQFYKEINQLENENLDTSVQEKEIETSREQYAPYICRQTSQEDYQGILLGSSQPFYENGQGFFEEPNSQNTTSEQQFVVETSSWKTESTSNEQVNSKYLNVSVPEFRPAWQSAESFIVPQGPLPPTFSHQSCFLNAPPERTSALPSHNDELSYTYYYGYRGDTDSNSYGPSLDQSTNYAGHVDIPPTQVFRNAHNDPHRLHNNDLNGLQNNGFCETREECWEDVKADNTEGMHSFSSLQLPEERFICSDKVLLILRGLPGSGKSTLSRALLAQSRGGIVFSTDDYFRQQDGYTYNAAHLGDAHDWNQKRAKEAMEQGRSPVIIDNTNTQAWEMKPYVEVALEKGYRVEFHEPDTWWKFDPGELEKRNKHGVTREKIAQMLERYEYQISIPIVLNSVAPPHKNTQRPPAQRRHRATILKNNPGLLLTKAKEKKKRKRNSKTESNRTEIRKKMADGTAHNPTPDDQNTSESEENDLEEEKNKSSCMFSESPEDPGRVCDEQHNNDHGSLKKAAVFAEETFPVVSEVSMRSNSPLKNELPAESDSSLLIDAKPFSTEVLTKTALDDEETNQRHKENVCRSSFLKTDGDKNSIQEAEGISEDYNVLLLSAQAKLGSYQITCEPDTEANLPSLNGEEKEVSQCYDSNVQDVADSNTEDKGALEAEENSSNAWTVLSAQAPAEELQLGFDTQGSLSWSEDKFVGEQRSSQMRKPKQTHTNNSTQQNCCHPNEGLMKGNHQVPVNEEAVSVTSNALLESPAGEVQLGAFVEATAPSMEGSSELNVPRNGVAPLASRRKRYRRIVSLAPKFNLPRQIAGSAEGEQEVLEQDGVPQSSVFEVGQESFLSQDHREECDQDFALQEGSVPYTDTKATCSSSDPDAGVLSHEISCNHSEQPSVPKYSCGVAVVVSGTEEQARTLEQQKVVDRKEDESEQVSSKVTNGQPAILSSVQVVSEHPQNSSTLASCPDHVHEADPGPAEASQLEDNTEVNMESSFLALPLSLGFALQLEQLFGSPGLPLGSLLPDDYIVPLDWKVSKRIYLLWKTSVEEKQKANGLQNENALADDLNKNCQENQEPSEILAEVEPCQGPTEEIVTSTSTNCVDDEFRQS